LILCEQIMLIVKIRFVLFDEVVLSFAFSGQPPEVGEVARPKGPVDTPGIEVPGGAASTSTEDSILHQACHHVLLEENGLYKSYK